MNLILSNDQGLYNNVSEFLAVELSNYNTEDKPFSSSPNRNRIAYYTTLHKCSKKI
jgi:hypothetical protein